MARPSCDGGERLQNILASPVKNETKQHRTTLMLAGKSGNGVNHAYDKNCCSAFGCGCDVVGILWTCTICAAHRPFCSRKADCRGDRCGPSSFRWLGLGRRSTRCWCLDRRGDCLTLLLRWLRPVLLRLWLSVLRLQRRILPYLQLRLHDDILPCLQLRLLSAIRASLWLAPVLLASQLCVAWWLSSLVVRRRAGRGGEEMQIVSSGSVKVKRSARDPGN